MKKINVFKALIDLKRTFINTLTPKCLKDHDGRKFTRKRVLWLGRLLVIILRCSPYSLQIRSDDYFKEIGYKEAAVSRQALSKARGKLDSEIVRESFLQTAHTLSSCEDLELYRGKYRLCAIDGSDIILDNAPELLDYFGGSGRNSDCATALASLCYDPLNNTILDGNLYPYGTDERFAAGEHIDAVNALPLPYGIENLFIFDRGYPSRKFIAELIDGKKYFLMRVRNKFNTDIDLAKRSELIYFEHLGKQYYVRVFKVILESGVEEILITNLKAKHLTKKEISDLYFKRWSIEIKYNSLKNKLELENMSGRRVCTTYQDFWAKLDMANTAAALQFESDEIIDEKTKGKNNKYKQRTNENRLITKFSDKYLDLLGTEDSAERMQMFEELIHDISRRPVEVKPGRCTERVPPRKKKFCDRIKRALR